MARLFDKYHPERHYMRGPGPRCLERQGDASVFPKIWRWLSFEHTKDLSAFGARDDFSRSKQPARPWRLKVG